MGVLRKTGLKGKGLATILVAAAAFLPVPAMAFSFTETINTIASLPALMIIGLMALALLAMMGILSVFLVSLPIIADVMLSMAAIFLPLAVAVYPVNKSWAGSAVGTVVGSAMIKVAAAFVINGVMIGLSKALSGVLGRIFPAGANTPNALEIIPPLLAGSVGLIIVVGILMSIVQKVPTIVGSIFGGATFGVPGFVAGAAQMATGATMGGVGGAARAGLDMGKGAAAGLGAAASMGASVAGAAMKGGMPAAGMAAGAILQKAGSAFQAAGGVSGIAKSAAMAGARATNNGFGRMARGAGHADHGAAKMANAFLGKPMGGGGKK